MEGGRGRFLGARRHEAPLRSSTLAHLHQTPPNTHIPPPRCLLSFSSPMPCSPPPPGSSHPPPCLALESKVGGCRKPLAACPPPAITALVTCAGAETTAARGLEDRCRCRFEAAPGLSGDTWRHSAGLGVTLLRHWRWRQVATLSVRHETAATICATATTAPHFRGWDNFLAPVTLWHKLPVQTPLQRRKRIL